MRGTTWLAQDTCTTTLTRVTQGVVEVRDLVKRKTIVLRAPKRYTARARGRSRSPGRLDSAMCPARPSRWFGHARRHPDPGSGCPRGSRRALRARRRVRPGRRELDGTPLNIFADGLGAIQVRQDGVAAGLFYDPDENPAHAGLEIKEGESYYPLEDGFTTAPGRVSAGRSRRRRGPAARS